MNINPFINLFSNIISLYVLLIGVWIVLGWLIYFQVVNPFQPFVRKLNEILTRLIDPLLRPIRRIIPDIGGLDISPILLILLLYFLRDIMYTYFYT